MGKNKLIYNFNEHGLYYENRYNKDGKKIITLTIDTIQMEFSYMTGNLLSIIGYLPIIKATRKHIDVPKFIEQEFSIPTDNIECFFGVTYNYCDYFIDSENYLFKDELPITYYDEINKRILIGSQADSDNCIKVNENIICGLDVDGNLKYLLISPDVIIEKYT